MRLAPMLAVALASLALPCPAQADPPAQAEAPEHPVPSARFTTMAAGVGMTAFWYGAAAGMSYAFPDAPGARDLRVPIAGPWMAIANNGCPPDEPDCSGFMVVLRTIVTAIDGIGQAGGPLIVLEGILMRTEPLPAERREDKGLTLLPLPRTIGSRGVGLGVSGRF
jgi:hypothetical protein